LSAEAPRFRDETQLKFLTIEAAVLPPELSPIYYSSGCRRPLSAHYVDVFWVIPSLKETAPRGFVFNRPSGAI
jgi:hypothetical protein